MGHIISKEGMFVAPHSMDKIRKFLALKNGTEVKRLLGLFSYYRAFIKGFSTIASPFIKLPGQKVEFNRTPECEAAAETLRTLESTDISFPNFRRPFLLATDALATVLGAVLSQVQEDTREHPISWSKIGKHVNSSQIMLPALNQETLHAIQFC